VAGRERGRERGEYAWHRGMRGRAEKRKEGGRERKGRN
jgi:hypothetical protein